MTENNINDFENMEEYSNIPKEVIPLLYEWESMPYSSWKNHITGKYILERHLKKGSVFINAYNQKVYP